MNDHLHISAAELDAATRRIVAEGGCQQYERDKAALEAAQPATVIITRGERDREVVYTLRAGRFGRGRVIGQTSTIGDQRARDLAWSQLADIGERHGFRFARAVDRARYGIDAEALAVDLPSGS